MPRTLPAYRGHSQPVVTDDTCDVRHPLLDVTPVTGQRNVTPVTPRLDVTLDTPPPRRDARHTCLPVENPVENRPVEKPVENQPVDKPVDNRPRPNSPAPPGRTGGAITRNLHRNQKPVMQSRPRATKGRGGPPANRGATRPRPNGPEHGTTPPVPRKGRPRCWSPVAALPACADA